jgi:hypothetical protein
MRWQVRRAARTSVGWTVAGALALAACGNVVVEGSPTTTGETPGTGSTGGSTPTAGTWTTSTSTTPTGSTPTPTGSTPETAPGGPCSEGCQIAITTGTTPCDGLGFAYYAALVATACGNFSMCAVECNTSLCEFKNPSAICMACLQTSYPDDLQNCAAH